ncbi:putative integral membrane protein [Acanthocheilonema viteae]
MIPNQLLRFISACIVVNAIIIGIAIKYSGEDISFLTLSIKIGVPLFITEAILMITLYPDETFDALIGDREFFQEIFESYSEQTLANTNIAHAVHSHGDIPENDFGDNNLRRRISIFASDS